MPRPPAPNTPASAHAARWWPNLSSGRPHRQVRRVKGRGGGVCDTTRNDMVAHLSLWSWTWAWPSVELRPKDRCWGSKQSPRDLRSPATRPRAQTAAPTSEWPFAATRTWAGWARALPPALERTPTSPSTKECRGLLSPTTVGIPELLGGNMGLSLQPRL